MVYKLNAIIGGSALLQTEYSKEKIIKEYICSKLIIPNLKLTNINLLFFEFIGNTTDEDMGEVEKNYVEFEVI